MLEIGSRKRGDDEGAGKMIRGDQGAGCRGAAGWRSSRWVRPKNDAAKLHGGSFQNNSIVRQQHPSHTVYGRKRTRMRAAAAALPHLWMGLRHWKATTSPPAGSADRTSSGVAHGNTLGRGVCVGGGGGRW
jgi:hypothetical protein